LSLVKLTASYIGSVGSSNFILYISGSPSLLGKSHSGSLSQQAPSHLNVPVCKCAEQKQN